MGDDNSDGVAGWGAHALSASSGGSSGGGQEGSSSGGDGDDASAVSAARMSEMKMLEMELNLRDGQTNYDDEDEGGMLLEDSAAQPPVLANLQFLRQQLEAPPAGEEHDQEFLLPSDFLAAHKERAALGIEDRWQQLESRFAQAEPCLLTPQTMSAEERRRASLWQNRWRLPAVMASATVHGADGEAAMPTPATTHGSNQRKANKQVKSRLKNAQVFFSRTQTALPSS